MNNDSLMSSSLNGLSILATSELNGLSNDVALAPNESKLVHPRPLRRSDACYFTPSDLQQLATKPIIVPRNAVGSFTWASDLRRSKAEEVEAELSASIPDLSTLWDDENGFLKQPPLKARRISGPLGSDSPRASRRRDATSAFGYWSHSQDQQEQPVVSGLHNGQARELPLSEATKLAILRHKERYGSPDLRDDPDVNSCMGGTSDDSSSEEEEDFDDFEIRHHRHVTHRWSDSGSDSEGISWLHADESLEGSDFSGSQESVDYGYMFGHGKEEANLADSDSSLGPPCVGGR